MTEKDLVLIHISDIHFRLQDIQSPRELNEDLRHELIRDIRDRRQEIHHIDGILITGDIAFGGLPQEYEKATEWITLLCKEAQCKPENVWVIPGNHDVNRSAIKGSAGLEDMHEKLRPVDPNQVDKMLERYLRDQLSATQLFTPLQAFNDFANRYECGTTPEKLYWESNLPLNDGTILRLRGINSAIVSDDKDDKQSNKLIVGTYQALVKNEDNVAYIVMCHHPTDWLIDNDIVEDYLDKSH
jgi:predicted MPP superfamily phosphohydrolase